MTHEKLIANAVVPVAGIGTRLLPLTKSQPKEMLPVGRKPVVQYVIEELENCGAERILFVTGKTKTSIENHFDQDPELVRLLREGGKEELLGELEFSRMKSHFFYTRQRRQLGLGDAVSYAEQFSGSEPFILALGDSIIGMGKKSTCVSRMVRVFAQQKPDAVIAFEQVPPEDTAYYGIADPDDADNDVFIVRDLVEKPKPGEAPSNLAIAARYVFQPSIFECIREVEPDRQGEIQLTDGIRRLIDRGGKVMGVRLPEGEKRYDIGHFTTYFNAFVEFALADPDYGPALAAHLKSLL